MKSISLIETSPIAQNPNLKHNGNSGDGMQLKMDLAIFFARCTF